MADTLTNSGDQRAPLTTRQGHPVYDNRNQRTVGARGPATLENYHFIEKISHFDRQTLTADELMRIENLGANGPRNVDRLVFTGIVPNEHHVVTRGGVTA